MSVNGFLAQFIDPALDPAERDGLLNVGHVGRGHYAAPNGASICARGFAGGQPRAFHVVSFFTADNEYRDHAETLRRTLERFAIAHTLVPVEGRGAWELDCAYKARFIREQWEQRDVPIIWLDADATVESAPELFSTIRADFAAHKWQGCKLGSGTLYFGRSTYAKALLDQWVARCEADPITWDQNSLHSAWVDIAASAPLETVWLPRPYLHIFDAEHGEPPVIAHWQASRRVKAEGRTTGAPEVQLTPAGAHDRMIDRLWRTPEEAFWIREGRRHIKPEIGETFPEGFDPTADLTAAVGDQWPLLEVGCGVGRLAAVFAPERYIGVDINPAAVAAARRSLPDHVIRITDKGYVLPEAPSALLYTVMLHVGDDQMREMLGEVSAGRERVIIAEIMDARWRNPDQHVPVFNRNPEDYILAMGDLGFALASYVKRPYRRYDVEPFNIGRDSRLTILTFVRRRLD
jgi:SAM-dependent methyltransferase